MKRSCFILMLAACLCLAGCGQPVPVEAADGSPWSGEWVTVGGVIGVETPERFTLRENNDVLSTRGMYYAAWSAGETEAYTNAEGEEAALYDAQFCLLLAGFDQAEKAEAAAAEWLELAGERYALEDTVQETRGGQEVTVITYTYTSEDNPYARGASAFGVYRNYAFSMELSCREDFDGDAHALLAQFLDGCHYAA